MDYFDYLKEIYKIKRKDIKVSKIGEAHGYPLLKILINSSGNKTACFSAGIHGEEIAGPLAVLEFIKEYKKAYAPHVKIVMFPLVNPSGFDKGQRFNKANINLNQTFDLKYLPKEDRLAYNETKKEKILFFHALHEDSEMKSFYLYNFESRPEKIYKDIISLAKKFFPINKSERMEGHKMTKGMVTNKFDKSFEARLYREGAVPYATCTETPMEQPLNKRIRLNVEIMKLILKFAERI